MARTLDDVIAEQADKTVTLTVAELFDVFREAFYEGHVTSQYCPNLNGSSKRAFIDSEVFEKVREQS